MSCDVPSMMRTCAGLCARQAGKLGQWRQLAEEGKERNVLRRTRTYARELGQAETRLRPFSSRTITASVRDGAAALLYWHAVLEIGTGVFAANWSAEYPLEARRQSICPEQPGSLRANFTKRVRVSPLYSLARFDDSYTLRL